MRELNIEPIRSVERAIHILNCFTFEKPVLTIDEIMEKTGLAKATTYRLLWTLERNHLIQYHATSNVYQLGTKALEYGGIVLDNLDICKETEPYLHELHEATGHSFILATQQAETVQYLLRIHSDEGLQPNNTVGRRRILHHGALGIVLLAYTEEDFIDSLLDEYPLVAHTPKTITEKTSFKDRLKLIRESGYYVDIDETFVGYTAIAVPIYGEKAKVIASIGLSGPSFKIEGERRENLIKLMKETAQHISKKMGKFYKD